MKLEVGMFYRYKGQIGKYKKITELDRCPSFTNNYLRENEVILLNNAKFSYNIIDILEVGDIIKYRIDNIPLETKGYLTGVTDITDEKMLESIKEDKNYHILQIVTKEQFEQMTYKVGE